MATSARIGHGSLFTIGDGGTPEAFVSVAEVTLIAAPSVTRDIVDVSHMEQSEHWREFQATLKDGGQAKLEMNFVPGGPGQSLIADLQELDEPSRIRIIWTDGVVCAFRAYCVGFEPNAPVDDKMAATATFRVTGPVDFDAVVGTFYLTLGPDYLILGPDYLTLSM